MTSNTRTVTFDVPESRKEARATTGQPAVLSTQEKYDAAKPAVLNAYLMMAHPKYTDILATVRSMIETAGEWSSIHRSKREILEEEYEKMITELIAKHKRPNTDGQDRKFYHLLSRSVVIPFVSSLLPTEKELIEYTDFIKANTDKTGAWIKLCFWLIAYRCLDGVIAVIPQSDGPDKVLREAAWIQDFTWVDIFDRNYQQLDIFDRNYRQLDKKTWSGIKAFVDSFGPIRQLIEHVKTSKPSRSAPRQPRTQEHEVDSNDGNVDETDDDASSRSSGDSDDSDDSHATDETDNTAPTQLIDARVKSWILQEDKMATRSIDQRLHLVTERVSVAVYFRVDESRLIVKVLVDQLVELCNTKRGEFLADKLIDPLRTWASTTRSQQLSIANTNPVMVGFYNHFLFAISKGIKQAKTEGTIRPFGQTDPQAPQDHTDVEISASARIMMTAVVAILTYIIIRLASRGFEL